MNYGPPPIDVSGKRFGRLTVIKQVSQKNKRRGAFFLCHCDCGKEKIIYGYSLRKNITRSCGCLHKEVAANINIKHGMNRRGMATPEYKSWFHMRQRCKNPNHKGFKNYGGKGISVCNRWDNFSNFLSDMGTKPTPKHTIDRVDNNGNYEPKNCKWSTNKEQNNNYSRNRIITFNGHSKNLSQWAEFLGVSRNLLYGRIFRGWSDIETITTPF